LAPMTQQPGRQIKKKPTANTFHLSAGIIVVFFYAIFQSSNCNLHLDHQIQSSHHTQGYF
ncbi:hypothetical protein ACP2ZY_29115, partial [Klebsiella pneumoniae subsp. pneumoniae]